MTADKEYKGYKYFEEFLEQYPDSQNFVRGIDFQEYIEKNFVKKTFCIDCGDATTKMVEIFCECESNKINEENNKVIKGLKSKAYRNTYKKESELNHEKEE